MFHDVPEQHGAVAGTHANIGRSDFVGKSDQVSSSRSYRLNTTAARPTNRAVRRCSGVASNCSVASRSPVSRLTYLSLTLARGSTAVVLEPEYGLVGVSVQAMCSPILQDSNRLRAGLIPSGDS